MTPGQAAREMYMCGAKWEEIAQAAIDADESRALEVVKLRERVSELENELAAEERKYEAMRRHYEGG